MKKRILKSNTISKPLKIVNNFGKGQEMPLQDVMYKYIKKHPHCTRKDLYSLNPNEGHVRRSITTMLKSNRVKETFTIVR